MSERAQPRTAPSDFLADTLAYIDAHLWDALSVAALADVAGLSPFHFSRCFAARLGASVISYVRVCRMRAATERLRNGAASLSDLAFDCGFESREAFTRAFRREFGVPPGQYQRAIGEQQNGKDTDMSGTLSIDLVQMEKRVHRGAFTIAGVRAHFEESNKSGIPALWPRLIQSLPLPGQVDGRSYGACWSTGQSNFNYMAGVEVAGDAKLPPGFERLDIAAQDYIVFRQTLDGSAIHPQMQAAAREIWGERLPKSGATLVRSPDFELYPVDFNPMQKGAHIDIYVAVTR